MDHVFTFQGSSGSVNGVTVCNFLVCVSEKPNNWWPLFFWCSEYHSLVLFTFIILFNIFKIFVLCVFMYAVLVHMSHGVHVEVGDNLRYWSLLPTSLSCLLLIPTMSCQVSWLSFLGFSCLHFPACWRRAGSIDQQVSAPQFYMGSGHLRSSSHVCVASALSSEPSP